jgi:hypothetical protein
MATQTESVQTQSAPSTITVAAHDVAEKLGPQPGVQLDPVKHVPDTELPNASGKEAKIRRIIDEEPNTTASVSHTSTVTVSLRLTRR